MGFDNKILKYCLIFGISTVFIIILINTLGKQQVEITTCDLPYKRVGTNCCLDQNNNSICDANETLADNGQINDTCQEEQALNDTTELEPEMCTKGYADEYNCSSQYITRKYYLDADCSYKWIKWRGCRILCKSVDNGVACEEEWPDYWPAEGEYRNYPEIGDIEASGYQTSYSCSHEISETISERAKVGIPLIVQGSVGVSWGTEGILNETCEVANVQVDIFVYKDNLELYSETLYTDEYGNWESDGFTPNETGEYKFAMIWPQGNIFPGVIWANADFFFNVTE